MVTENTLKLVKLQYNFLCWDPAPPHEKYTERVRTKNLFSSEFAELSLEEVLFMENACTFQIIEDIMMLMDLMTVFDVDTGWREMEQLGLAILLGFAAQKVRAKLSRKESKKRVGGSIWVWKLQNNEVNCFLFLRTSGCAASRRRGFTRCFRRGRWTNCRSRAT